jgi:hypothetical protein
MSEIEELAKKVEEIDNALATHLLKHLNEE